ncbi:MAG TPA: DEAD/DEAH box helicase [Anaerolineae bacterium]|nr:DEAD/DEAH box helicase [Anaerolineae bacterium]
MQGLQRALERIRLTEGLCRNITLWRVIEASPAEYGETPSALDPRLVKMLAAQGIQRLYLHQSLAVGAILDGQNVVVVTPTASGKTLCYNLPVLDALLHDDETCALYMFPTKALAHDQLNTLQASAGALGLATPIASYDGDTPTGRRARVRRSARVLLTNPDMLHVGILPNHARWRGFFGKLRYVVIDEMHQYRGIFGSHVANVLRRLERICSFYGSEPQFVTCSATIANPVDLAKRLLGKPVTLVSRNGAPRGKRTFVFYNPPVVNRELGLRRSAIVEARAFVECLLSNDVQTLVFTTSRLSTELLLAHLRDDAQRAVWSPQAIRGYRGGYLPTERRSIERGLREGTVRCAVATNALELGVDIGGLSASIMVGYPGTIASAWQQAGRAGRGLDDSAAFLVARSSPLDQYIISHPDYFFGRSPEHALIDPDNLHVLLSHVKCASFELPFAEGETYGDESLEDLLGFLAEGRQVRKAGSRWHWTGEGCPAYGTSLRTADPVSVAIVAQDKDGGRRTVGQLDRAQTSLLLHQGAIYLHDGQQYLVESLDWDAGLALVQPVEVDYYTRTSQSTRIEIERVLEETSRPNFCVAQGEATVTWHVAGYRRVRLGSGEHLGWGEVDLPEQQMLTSACWITLSDGVVERLRDQGGWVGDRVEDRGPGWQRQRDLARRRDHYLCRWCGAPERPGRQHHVHHIVPFRDFAWVPAQNENHRQANRLANLITLCPNCHRQAEQHLAVQSTLSGLGRVLGHLIPLFLMCDPRDVGIASDVQAPQTGSPTIFIYDRIPGGVGLSEQVLSLCDELLARAAELVRGCQCAFGCPSCIGPGGESNREAKPQVLRLIAALRGQEPLRCSPPGPSSSLSLSAPDDVV